VFCVRIVAVLFKVTA